MYLQQTFAKNCKNFGCMFVGKEKVFVAKLIAKSTKKYFMVKH